MDERGRIGMIMDGKGRIRTGKDGQERYGRTRTNKDGLVSI